MRVRRMVSYMSMQQAHSEPQQREKRNLRRKGEKDLIRSICWVDASTHTSTEDGTNGTHGPYRVIEAVDSHSIEAVHTELDETPGYNTTAKVRVRTMVHEQR